MAYEEAPVYDNPPSNQWFGMQTWSMERLAEYYYLNNDPLAKEILDKWVAWVIPNVQLPADGTFAIPGDLAWSGQPNVWNPVSPGANTNLHVTILDTNQDVGVTASLCPRADSTTARRPNDGECRTPSPKPPPKPCSISSGATNRDSLGVSVGESRSDYAQFFDQPVYAPTNWLGHMPDGDTITNNVCFVGLRSKYRNDPAFPAFQSAYTTPGWPGAAREPFHRQYITTIVSGRKWKWRWRMPPAMFRFQTTNYQQSQD